MSSEARPATQAVPDSGQPTWVGSSAGRDLFWLTVAIVCASLAGLSFDAFDVLAEWLSEHEHWELDELVLPVFLAPLGVSWFAYRRWQEARAETASRRAAEGRLRALADTLEEQVQQRTAEAERRAEALARSNRELEHFAHVASHDLQEPLRKIIAFGDRLGRQANGLDDRGRQYLSRMQSATARMQALVDSLLMLSRVTTRAGEFVPVDLSELADTVVSDLSVRIREQGARVMVGDLPRIEADPIQVRQLLQNLIANSLKFRREDVAPEIRVTGGIERGWPGIEVHQEVCRVEVGDNGIGFDEKYLERIFKPFQRLHGRSEYEGTGMGLAICTKIAERHGGALVARSSEGNGATFTITLPVRQDRGGES